LQKEITKLIIIEYKKVWNLIHTFLSKTAELCGKFDFWVYICYNERTLYTKIYNIIIKEEKCMNWFKFFVIGVVAALAISFAIGLAATNVQSIDVNDTVATIRVPGEFEDEVKIQYNGKYVTHTTENSIIKFNFLKSGYYHISLMEHEYVFVVSPDKNAHEYDVDLINQELSQIKGRLFCKYFIPCAILSNLGVVVAIFIIFGIPAIKNKKNKFPKIKQSKGERIDN